MKRAFDVLVVVVLGAMLWPVMLLVALLVRLKLGSPVIFRQERPGLGGAPFMMRKFRTLREMVDEGGVPLPDEQRMTRFGNWLRSTSLDELPELWNVLVGDMSLVGPRPLLAEYLPLYNREQARRHDVRPGITGWAQVNGRNALTWEKKFELDVWYVEHHSFWLDLKILWMTVAAVVFRRGVSAEGHATMPKFTGTPDAPS